MFPRPMADPMAAMRKPNWPLHCSRSGVEDVGVEDMVKPLYVVSEWSSWGDAAGTESPACGADAETVNQCTVTPLT